MSTRKCATPRLQDIASASIKSNKIKYFQAYVSYRFVKNPIEIFQKYLYFNIIYLLINCQYKKRYLNNVSSTIYLQEIAINVSYAVESSI